MSARKHCRFCAELKPALEIMDFENDIKLRQEITQKLLHFSVNCVDFSNNSLPEAVCLHCYDCLNSAYEFLKKIKNAQETLRELHMSDEVKIEKYLNSEDSIDNYESNVYIKYESPPTISLEIFDDSVTSSSKRDLVFPPSTCEIDWDKNDWVISNWQSYSWICKLCSEIFTDLASLRNHSKALHGVCNSFECTDCGRGIEIFYDFIEHIRSHRSDLKNFCPYCNIKLEDENDPHIGLHTSKPECHLCGETFSDENERQTHFEIYCKSKEAAGLKLQESWNDYSWICKFCSILLPNENMLRMHTKEMHKKCFGMQCVDCKISNETFSSFVAHVRSHRPNLKNFCQYCNHTFDDSQDTVPHLAKHFDGQFQCEDCSEVFPSRDGLQRHTKLYRTPSIEERTKKSRHRRKRIRPITAEDLTCDVCQKVMKTLNGLYKHRQLHKQRSRDYTCDRCGKAFFSKACLTSHILIHENNKPQVCQICKKTFLTLTRLKKHVLTHSGEKPFKCTECNRCFRLKEQLKGHQITHTDLLPYSCQYCDKAFRHKNVKRIHENQHTGAQAYPCKVCDKVLSNWSNCNKHMKRKHGITLAKNKLTPQGRLPINPKTGRPKKINMENVKEWTEKIMAPVNRRKVMA